MHKPSGHRARGAAHVTLQHLKRAGALSVETLTGYVESKLTNLGKDIFMLSMLPRMAQEGLIWISEGDVTPTEEGLKLLETFEAKKPALIPKDETVVQANLYTASSDKTTYTAPELRHVAWRPGAFDYLNCPSVIAGKQTPYFIKLKE